ncbi:hypothetical protein OL239_03440 [Arthrobacter sp. ATA002]|uniref:hypothetical protein n=1 Tax=Arthrobacter sp. ATA002 TaxID=2991715 RepID=UPI0022A66805|nr:hypothetical protein [Arthrobacter sp. ATA002]WAP52348.1 hypothetical protein OL239_03440 [Arthrobacter sp. ATA002]
MPRTSDKLSPEGFAAVQEQLELLFPSLEETAAGSVELSVYRLRESSCLPPELDNPHTQTSWQGILRGQPADAGAAYAAIDALALELQSEDWAVTAEHDTPDVEIGQVRIIYLKQGAVNLRLIFERGYPDTVEVVATTACVDHPKEHRMQRSELDPDYGTSSQFYPDGD